MEKQDLDGRQPPPPWGEKEAWDSVSEMPGSVQPGSSEESGSTDAGEAAHFCVCSCPGVCYCVCMWSAHTNTYFAHARTQALTPLVSQHSHSPNTPLSPHALTHTLAQPLSATLTRTPTPLLTLTQPERQPRPRQQHRSGTALRSRRSGGGGAALTRTRPQYWLGLQQPKTRAPSPERRTRRRRCSVEKVCTNRAQQRFVVRCLPPPPSLLLSLLLNQDKLSPISLVVPL